jgi:anti-sigma factor (TIGR02949 family)
MTMSFFDRLKQLLGSGGERTGSLEEVEGECTAALPISCHEALEKLHEYLDGELEEASAAEVAHHFEICQKCFPHLRLEERFREALHKSGARDQCPEHVRVQVLELLAAESREGG